MSQLSLQRYFLALLLFFTTASVAFGQERLGLRLGNFSGIHGAMFNPALPNDGPLKWQVSLFSGGAFFEQNFYFFPKSSILSMIRESTEGQYNAPRKFTGLATAEVHGPSFMFKVQDHTFGMFIGARAWGNMNRVDGDLNYETLTDTNTVVVGSIQPFTAGAMAWAEIGLNYSREIMPRAFFTISGGMNFKVLLGLEGAHLWNQKQFDMLKIDNGVQFVDPSIRLTHASSYRDQGISYDGIRGYGAAVDIGFTITDKDAITSKRHHYWKFGVSLLDVGMVRFSKFANVNKLESNDTLSFTSDNFDGFSNFDDLLINVNLDALGSDDPQATLQKNTFSMWLPTAVAIYMDYAIADYVYITGAATIPMAFRNPSIRRKGMLSITPRFEMSYLEIGIPVVMFQYRYPRIGTYMRLGPLTIGTDNLNSFILPGRLDGSDVYVALKFHGIFKKKRMNPGTCPRF